MLADLNGRLILMAVFERARIGNITFNPATRAGALDHIFEMAPTMSSRWVVTSNADHLLRAREEQRFRDSIAAADFVVSDGWPIVATLKAMGFSYAERVTGADLLPAIAERCARTGQSIFVMGGMEGWADLAAKNLQSKFPGVKIAGTFFPPFGFEKDKAVCEAMVSAINAVKPDFLFLGVGSPKQENWICDYRDKFTCGVVIGVGMSIGFAAGMVPRAPILMQKFYMEWFFRMCTEPKRLAPRYAKDLLIFPSLLRAVWNHKYQSGTATKL
jgi:exopolysaccharide biosynthesis WecB/TagA/CpsF family protein